MRRRFFRELGLPRGKEPERGRLFSERKFGFAAAEEVGAFEEDGSQAARAEFGVRGGRGRFGEMRYNSVIRKDLQYSITAVLCKLNHAMF